MIAIIYIGTQRGPDHPADSLDLYNLHEPGHPGHGGTFAVPHGSGTDVVAARAGEAAAKFVRDAAARDAGE